MEFTQLQSFVTAAQSLNFSQAAEILGYSQSAISVHIQQLEKELGCLLFERFGRKVYLSQQGQIFYEYAANLLHQAQLAKNALSDQEVPKGLIRLGIVESICHAILPGIVQEIHSLYPQIYIEVSFGTTEELQLSMVNNQLDLVITVDYLIHGHEWVSLCHFPQKFLFIAALPYADQIANIELEDLMQLPFILTQKASYRFELEQVLAHRGISIQPFMQISDPETILNTLRKGIGLTFLPSYAVTDALAEGSVCKVPINIDINNIYIQAFYHQNKIITPGLQAFIDSVLKYLERLSKI